jgi:hypothetical protein
MGAFPTVDESRDRLHRTGWSVGEIATTTRWLVMGSNGENQIKGHRRRNRDGSAQAKKKAPRGWSGGREGRVLQPSGLAAARRELCLSPTCG